MAWQNPPEVGAWYMDHMGRVFEIVASDEDDETIEIQYMDGTIEELDLETWAEFRKEPISPPEDWVASMDMDPNIEGWNHLHGDPVQQTLDALERQE